MNEIIENYMETSLDPMANEEANQMRKFEFNYKNIFPRNSSAMILDIGVGRGAMLTCLAKWGYVNAKGVDISPSTIRHCQARGLRCELVQDTVLYLNEKPGMFDCVTLLDVLEHLEKKDVIPLLKAVFVSLKSGGSIIIQVPNLQAPDGFLHRYNDFTHESGFTENSLRQILITAGFKEFFLKGLEEYCDNSLRKNARKFLRSVYWSKVRFERFLNTNLNPQVLNPILFAVAKK